MGLFLISLFYIIFAGVLDDWDILDKIIYIIY